MDPLTSPTAAITTEGNPAGSPQVVNPAQAPATLPSTSLDAGQISGMIATYEQRIRNLMSEKDKAINERNQAITAQTTLQQQLTELQAQTSTSLTGAAQAAQTAIDEAKTLRARVQVLEGEVLRARLLAEHTELIPYSEFIPATTDENVLRETVQKLTTIRQQDMERSRVTAFPGQQYGTPPTPAVLPAPGTPQSAPSPLSLYQNRPNMAPGLPNIPASSPAQMHPAGATSTVESIDQMLRDARASGKPGDFEAAVQRAAMLAQQNIQAQLGGSR